MELINGLSNLKQKIENSVVTIGKFDGVHLGHQELIKNTVCEAQKSEGTSVALTFNQHPGKLVNPQGKLGIITPLHHKIELIRNLGVDILIIINFDPCFAKLSPHEFVRNIIINRLGTKLVIVGPDFRFGKNRSGNIGILQQLGKQYDFSVKVISFVKIGETRVSSTKIRSLVWEKELETASQMLGRKYVFVV